VTLAIAASAAVAAVSGQRATVAAGTTRAARARY
jgi:hypothetical protein